MQYYSNETFRTRTLRGNPVTDPRELADKISSTAIFMYKCTYIYAYKLAFLLCCGNGTHGRYGEHSTTRIHKEFGLSDAEKEGDKPVQDASENPRLARYIRQKVIRRLYNNKMSGI